MKYVPSRGDIWMVNLEPVVGHEQGRTRPAVIVSNDQLNHGPSGLVTVIPITKKHRQIPIHINILRGQGGLTMDSCILCDQIRTISKERLIKPLENVEPDVMNAIVEMLKVVLDIY